MSKIYISYTNRDRDFAQALMGALEESGHALTIDPAKITAGINWRSALNEALKAADVFVILLSRSSLDSQYPLMELGAAKAFAESSGRMLILPIVLDDIPIPTIVQDIQVIFARQREPQELLPEINQAISAFEGRKSAAEVADAAIAEAVREDLAKFVEEAIETQKKYEQSNKDSAVIWYRVGFAVLVTGVIPTLFLAYRLLNSVTVETDFARMISLSLLNIIVVGLLAALAKYAYSLGKSYMSESLKSSDRIHAIQFGKFYLRAFGSKVAPSEVKEVFQHWNIDRASTFSSLDSAQIDPQIVSLIASIVSSVMSKRNKAD